MVTLLSFYAPWCDVSSDMEPIINNLVVKYPIKHKHLNVEDAVNYDERIKWRVRTVPTFILLENDVMMDRVEGAFTYDRGVNWLDDNLGITLEKERHGDLPLIK